MTHAHPLVGACRADRLPEPTLPGVDPDAPQAAGGLPGFLAALVLHVLGPDEAGTPDVPIPAVVEDVDDPAERDASMAEGRFNFVRLLVDDNASAYLSEDSVGGQGVSILRGAQGFGRAELVNVVALQMPEGWMAVTVPDAHGNGVLRLDERAHGQSGVVVATLEPGQLLGAADPVTGRFALVERTADGKLDTYYGQWTADALLQGEAWAVTQPAWLEHARSDAKGRWLDAVDVLGARLRGGNDVRLRSLEDILAHEEALRATIRIALPPVARTALTEWVKSASWRIAEDARRILPPEEVLASGGAERDEGLWGGDTLSDEGVALLADAILTRERAESVLACLGMAGDAHDARMALNDADHWLRRTAAIAGTAPVTGATAARFAAVGAVDADAWWTSHRTA
jgi:hypothetical protein